MTLRLVCRYVTYQNNPWLHSSTRVRVTEHEDPHSRLIQHHGRQIIRARILGVRVHTLTSSDVKRRVVQKYELLTCFRELGAIPVY